VERPGFLAAIDAALRHSPVVALLGPRQCGKTTLARRYARGAGRSCVHLDLEDPTDQARLADPKLALEPLRGLVVLDEIQRAPGLFELLRVLVDRARNPARFLILGSASRDLIRQSSETLAGRIRYLELTPFQLTETGPAQLRRLWLRGGFPRSYLAPSDRESLAWRKSFVTTFLERDIPNLGVRIPAAQLRRFWMMLAHCHGQILNASELGRSLELADTTVRRYLDLLSGTFMVRQLQPWFANISKRQVKAPKIYFRDSGILHSFLGVDNPADLAAHPKLGASWEGFALEEVIRSQAVGEGEVFFWASHGGAELDLLLLRGSRRIGYEIKYTSRPALSKSVQIAGEDLKLDRVDIVYPGEKTFPVARNVRAVGLAALFRKPAR
jgi:predicted AAA+ superfamily ATPase